MARHPVDPIQQCVVTTGTGIIRDANVSSVSVDCDDAGTVTLDINLPDSAGADVAALLFSTGSRPRLAARAPRDASIKGGKGVFLLKDPTASDSNSRSEPDAFLAGGTYRLYVFVNHDGSTEDQSKPEFNGGDLGLHRTLTVTPGQTNAVGVGAAVPLLSARVLATHVPNATGRMFCWWSPPDAGPLVPPVNPKVAPVVGISSVKCEPSSETCPNTALSTLATTSDPGLPLGATFDRTCWVDKDGDENVGPTEVFFSGDISATTGLAVP